MPFARARVWSLFFGLYVLFASSAQAAPAQLQILIDSDHNAATGCRVITAAGNFDGVEQIVTTTFDTTVTGVTREQCVDPSTATFGPAVTIDTGGWTVGSAGGSVLLETHLGVTAPRAMRLGFVVSSGTLLDTVLSQPDGSPIIFPAEYTGHGRRRVVTLDHDRHISLDGEVGDWSGIGRLVGDAQGIGSPALQFLDIWAYDSPRDTFFRCDIQRNPNAPRANPDTYTTLRGSTLTVPAPGVLANDSDPNNKPLTAVLVSGPEHGSLTLNAHGGFTYVNDGSPAPVDSFRYKASNGTDLSNATISALIIVNGIPPVITSPNHVTFTVGVAGTFTVTRTGVPPPSLSETGALPAGVTFNPSTGILSGTPGVGTGGNYAIQFTATNIVGTGSQNFTLTVNEAPAITSANSVHLQAGVPANFLVTTSGFPRPAITRTGTLPAGVTFADNGNGTATIGGTPAGGSGGTYPLTLTATNIVNTANQAFSIVVCNSLAVTNPGVTTGTANAAFSQTFAQAGGVGAVTFSLSSGTLPAGLSLSAGGALSGTPAQTGTFPIIVRVTDSLGCIGVGASYNLVIGCQIITVTDPATATGTANTPFSQAFTATNTIGATTFTTTSTLPVGLALSAGGVLSGTPLQKGTFPIVVKATDANGCFGTGATYNLVIGCQVITVNNPVTTTGTANTPFNEAFTATNTIGVAAFTTASTLPAGLTLSTGGVLSGTPAQTGTFPILVTATDGNGCPGMSGTYTLVIACQTISVNSPATNTGTVNQPFSQMFTATNTIGATTFTTTSALPAGITLSAAGLLAGTPTQPGAFPIVVTATDANGCAGNSATYTLTIACQLIAVTNPLNASGPAGTPFSVNFTQTGGVGTTNFTTASTLPAGLTLATNGALSGTPAQGGTFPIVVVATDSNGCAGTGATYNLIITCPVITVTNPVVATGTVGVAFSQTFAQSGGNGTITFTTASALPTGLILATNGTLSGTPSQFGTFPIVVRATDQNGCIGNGSTYNLAISCPTITVTNPVVNSGTAGTALSQTFTQAGGFGATTFSTASTLPAGLTLSAAGVLSGTPTQTGVFPIAVTATDSAGCTGTGTTYTLTIGCPTITVTNPLVSTGSVNVPFSRTFTQTGSVGGATFTTASALPTGLTLSAAGVLSGIPAVNGNFPIVVTVTDGNGCTGTGATYNLVINCQSIAVTNPVNTTGTVNVAFSEQFTQAGGAGLTTFSTASALPAGFSLNPNTGILSGTTMNHATFPIVVVATDSNGCTGTSATYNLVINCQTITVTNPVNNTGTVAVPFSEQFAESGALGGATFTTASALPTGLTLSASGLLSGTPLQAGTFNITVTATDGNGCTGSSPTYSLVIICKVITVTNPAVTTGTVGTAFSHQFTQAGGNGTVTFTTASTLPAGLTLATNGTLSGTPTQAGSFPIVVTATDANGCTGTGATYNLVIACQTITVTNPATSTGTRGTAFSQTFTQTGAIGGATFTTASTLPVGLSLSTAGVLSGAPTDLGTFPIVVTVTDGNGCTGTSATYNLVINCQTITVTSPGATTGTVSTPFSQTFTQSGAIGGATFTTASTLPAGLTLSTAGVLSGTPTRTGTFPIVVTVTDAGPCNGTGTTYTLSIAPVANGDSYSNLVDNTQAAVTGGLTVSPGTPFVGLTGAIIANDLPAGGVTATAGTFATAAGGTVTIQTDGTFLYTPKANPGGAATTSDSFTYTVSSNTGGVSPVTSASALVSLTLANRVWYVKNNAGGTNGQSQSPFGTLAAAAAASTANDIIFVYNGDGTNSGQNAGISLKNGQQLLGEINGLMVNAQTLVAVGSRPVIGNSSGDGVTVSASAGSLTGVFIKGLSVAGTANGINLNSSGANTLTATADNVVVAGATANNGISITGGSSGTSTVTVQNSTVSSATQNGIDAQQTTPGNLVLSINNNTVAAVGTGINVNGAGSTSTTITNFANNLISGNTVGSGIVVNAATFDAVPGGTFQTVLGGTLVIGVSGNGVGASGMVLTGVSGDLGFTNLAIFADNGTGLRASGTTPFTGSAGFQIAVGAGVASSTAIGGPAVDLTLVTASLPFNSISSTNSATTGVSLDTVLGTFSAPGGSTISNAAGTDFNINAGTATVTYGGSITDTTGRLVSITNTTGGTKSFTGTVSDANSGIGTGISLTSNTGATINFSGPITLSTGSNPAFTATGGGTVSASDTTSTLTTTTGTALTVSNTTIGASGLNFRSISANGGSNGIFLNNTGATAGLTVSGDGVNTSVGGNASGGTISNMIGADGTTSGIGIYLNNVTNVTLRRITISGTNQNHGIRGLSVNGFVLEYSTVGGTNGTNPNNIAGDNYGEGSVMFGNAAANGATGTVTFTSDNISGGRARNVSLVNGGAVSATTLTVKGCTFGAMQNFTNGNQSFAVEARTSGSTINSTFGGPLAGEPNALNNAVSDLANFTGQTGTTMDVQFKNNTLSNNNPSNIIGGGSLNLSTQGSMTFVVDGNTMRDANGSAVTLFKASAGTLLSGRFTNNTIGVAAVADSGSKTGNGIFVSAGGTGTMAFTITGNTIHQIAGNAHIYADNTGGSYAANFTIQGNLMDTPGLGWFAGIAITNGAPLSTDTVNVCATIGGGGAQQNTLNVGAANLGVIVGSSGAAAGHTFNLPGYAGGANLTNVQNFIQGNNAGSFTTNAYADAPATAAAFTGTGTSCPTP